MSDEDVCGGIGGFDGFDDDGVLMLMVVCVDVVVEVYGMMVEMLLNESVLKCVVVRWWLR